MIVETQSFGLLNFFPLLLVFQHRFFSTLNLRVFYVVVPYVSVESQYAGRYDIVQLDFQKIMTELK